MEAATYILTALVTLALIGGAAFFILHREIRRETHGGSASRKWRSSHHDTALGKEQGFTDATHAIWVDGAGSASGGSSDD